MVYLNFLYILIVVIISMNEKGLKPLAFTLKIPRNLWMEWKITVPRPTSLNAALIRLIENDIREKREYKR